MVRDLLVSLLKKDKKFQAISQGADTAFLKIEEEIKKVLIYSRIDEVPDQVLDLLAWQFHVDFWREDLSDESKRELVKNSIEWHRHKGTVWAVKKALEWVGIEAEVVEFWQARKLYEDQGGARLDGLWKLDGTKKLVPYYNVTGLSYMDSWAEFCVRLNLASMELPDWSKLVKWAVAAAKNARSWPVFVYWLALESQVFPLHSLYFFINKQMEQSYPWCTKRLDGSWRLGSGGTLYSLDGSLRLDGSWKLGNTTPVYADVKLKQCNIFYSGALLKDFAIAEDWITLRLGLNRLRLDGGWKLGKNSILSLLDKKMTKIFPITAKPLLTTIARQQVEIDYPARPKKLGSYFRLDGRRLDGEWKIGCDPFNRKLNGSWKVRSRKGVSVESDLQSSIFACSGLPAQLGCYTKLGTRWAYKLNGGWQLGAYRKLDGSWELDGQAVLGARKLGWHFVKVDGSWRLGEASKKLDGSWAIGHSGPTVTVKITRRAA